MMACNVSDLIHSQERGVTNLCGSANMLFCDFHVEHKNMKIRLPATIDNHLRKGARR